MSQFHPIYPIWFLWVDPILTIAGMYGNLLDHDMAALAFFSNYPATERLKPFMYQIGGMGRSRLFCCVMQLAIIWADFTLLTAMYVAMRLEGRLAISDWRVEDWFSIVTTGMCTVLRALFVLGVGVNSGKGKKE
ncbi:hypothetical protein QQZ08_010848 [Neonectria magnoliae]|uniref:EXPERA domain-containing protein n=1 Tax=Neonectria magnoliae TaxID=2732573 RepID=A0ABR1HFD9_9HYPO